jgi:hypothetical protein
VADETEVVPFDLNSLTYREAIDLEKAAGIPITALGAEGSLMMGFAAGIAWITERRSTPGLTFDEFLDRQVDFDGGMLAAEAVKATPTNGDESKPSD